MPATGFGSGGGCSEALFDPENLRLNPNEEIQLGSKKLITTIRIGRLGNQTFFRVHPDERYRLTTTVINDKREEEMYLVIPALRSELAVEVIVVCIFTVLDREGALSLWPVTLPGPDGRINSWHRSALQATELATKKWIRLMSNQNLKAYTAVRFAAL